MPLNLVKTKLIIILCFSIFTLKSIAQNSENTLIFSKYSNENKINKIEPNSYFKLRTFDGNRIKGKFLSISANYFISLKNDTIYYNDIDWIKARMQLTKWEKGIAIAGLFAGMYFSMGTVPAAFYFVFIEENYLIILAPAATISAASFGFKTLKGRKYKMKKWKLETQSPGKVSL